MTYRLRNIGIAIALAVVAALLTTFYVTNYKRSVQHGESRSPSTSLRATSSSARPGRTSQRRHAQG